MYSPLYYLLLFSLIESGWIEKYEEIKLMASILKQR